MRLKNFALGCFAILALPLVAHPAATNPSTTSASAPAVDTADTVRDLSIQLEAEREQRRQAEFREAIAAAKLEVIDAGNSQLENWIGFYGIFITVILAVAGYVSWKAAANAARVEVQDIRDRIEKLRDQATIDRDEIERANAAVQDSLKSVEANAERVAENRLKSEEMTAELKHRLASLPSEQDDKPSKELLGEAQRFATAAAEKPVLERTGQDLRLLMFEAETKNDWSGALAFAKELSDRRDVSEEDRGYAIFKKAYALGQLELWEAASKAYEHYLTAFPSENNNNRASALSNWGLVLNKMARTKDSEEADGLWRAAIGKYEAALELDPENHHALNNWGIALDEMAQRRQGPEADDLRRAAFGKYEATLQIKPDFHHALNNWGTTLDEMAQGRQGAEADDLRRAAFGKYEAALQIKPDCHEALGNWGSALVRMACTKQGEEAESLWRAAFGKYEAALQIKPDYHEALSNWASGIIQRSSSLEAELQQAQLQEAEALLNRAEAVQKGSGSYNLACVAGLRGNADKAAEWLRFGKANGKRIPKCAHIAADTDFDAVRDSDAFQQALKDIGCLPMG